MTFAHRPKIELHMHLEGAMPPEFALELAGEKGVDLSASIEKGQYKYQGFLEFLKTYEHVTSVITTPEDYYRLTRAVLEQSAQNGVIYTESFIAPDFCGGGDVAAWRDYLAAIKQAADEMEREKGIMMRAIATVVRHFGPDVAKKIGICAQETAGDFVTGFGMGGDENVGKQGDYKFAYDMAREAGLGLTTHAGEWGGVPSILQAIDDLGVSRIGHGVQAIEDPKLVDYLIEKNITLEICPISNIVLGVYPKMQDHPISRLKEAGVKVTVSTDDPPFFHSTMNKEYSNLSDVFGWNEQDLLQIERNAIESAFCDKETKEKLFKQIEGR